MISYRKARESLVAHGLTCCIRVFNVTAFVNSLEIAVVVTRSPSRTLANYTSHCADAAATSIAAAATITASASTPAIAAADAPIPAAHTTHAGAGIESRAKITTILERWGSGEAKAGRCKTGIIGHQSTFIK